MCVMFTKRDDADADHEEISNSNYQRISNSNSQRILAEVIPPKKSQSGPNHNHQVWLGRGPATSVEQWSVRVSDGRWHLISLVIGAVICISVMITMLINNQTGASWRWPWEGSL